MSTESPVAAPDRDPRHLVVMGLMGSGKTTLGTELAAELDWRYSDSDRELQERTGLTGAQFAQAHGVDALHLIEAALVLMALGSNERTVITAAASTIENGIVRRVIRSRAVATYLDVPVEELVRRHERGTHRRNLESGELQAQLTRRQPLFVDVADLVVAIDVPISETVSALRDLVG